MNVNKDFKEISGTYKSRCSMFYSMIIAMTCRLRGEMRIILAVLNKILIKGYSSCVNGALNSEIRGSGPARFNKCITCIEHIVSTKTLGDDYNPSQWRFPMMINVSSNKVGELKSDNTRERKLM